MQPVISAAEASRLDRAATVPVDVLMDRAGLAVALAAVSLGAEGYGSRVTVLAGPGNNGGDGYVAARYLAKRGAHVTVAALAPPKAGGPAERAAAAARRAGVRVGGLDELSPTDVIVDALFGSGFHGSLPAEAKGWSDVPARVVAVDVPSGLDADTGDASEIFRPADRTVTFHALKLGQVLGDGPDVCGRVSVADIGLEGGVADLLLCEAEDAPRPCRTRRAHKWTSGSVAVVGGSAGIGGAALLCAKAALAFGAGAVRLIGPGDLAPGYVAQAPEILVAGVGGNRLTGDDAGAVFDLAERFDVMALGPGLGGDAGELVTALLQRWDRPLVVDADGINALSGADALTGRPAQTVVTPHAGEFTRLTGATADFRAAASFARASGATVLLKGNPTFVASGDAVWGVRSGGPELATIGTGDVLTGMLAALWARGLEPAVAARSAAYWHGVAGADGVAGGGLTADRMLDAVARRAAVV